MIKARQKRALTLLEIMIVIVLIGLIGSVIGFNVKGSLDEGKAFKTETAQEQIKDLLLLEVARGTPLEEVVATRREVLINSGMIKDVDSFMKDGWGIPFHIELGGHGDQDLLVWSDKLKTYQQTKKNRIKSSGSSAQPPVSPAQSGQSATN